MGLIVDSSVLIEAERRASRLTGPELLEILSLPGETEFSISVVTLTEIVYGHASNLRASGEVKLQSLRDIRMIFSVIPVTDEIAIQAGRLNATLRQNGTPIGLADVLIAATALELGFGVLTHNVRHFSYVPELRVVNAAGL